MNPSDSSAIIALRSCRVSTTRRSVTPRMGQLAIHEAARDDADDLAARIEGRVRHGPHQPDPSAAVDEADPTAGEARTDRSGERGIGGIAPRARAAEDAQAHPAAL